MLTFVLECAGMKAFVNITRMFAFVRGDRLESLNDMAKASGIITYCNSIVVKRINYQPMTNNVS